MPHSSLIVPLGNIEQLLREVTAHDSPSFPGQIAQSLPGSTGHLKNIHPVTELSGEGVPLVEPLQLVLRDLIAGHLRYSAKIGWHQSSVLNKQCRTSRQITRNDSSAQVWKLRTASITMFASSSVSSGYMGRDSTSADIRSVIGKLK